MQRERQNRLEIVLGEYIKYEKNDEKFSKYMEKESEKYIKDGTSDSVRDIKQPEVSKSKWCAWMWTRARKKKTINKKKGKTDNENIWNIIKSTFWKWVGNIF